MCRVSCVMLISTDLNSGMSSILSGNPVVAAPRSLLLVSPDGTVVQNKRGRPVPVPRGSKITPVQHDVVVDTEGNPILEENSGVPLQVTPGKKGECGYRG